ncbi:MAG: DTW domain-containing protein [Halobacteriovoraceae bacterium]|mgnify:CR=1 FL=1|jgi:DTW domain-containing protein|nr:DTW domain-containing protein [Halobacteriovoraceae bacterium]
MLSGNILTRKRKTKAPCPNCFLHLDLCLCSLIPILNLKTKVSMVIHHKELKRTSNTGQLALKSLINSNLRVRGLKDSPLELGDLLTDEYETLLLFPSSNAEVLTPELAQNIKKKIQIIVPDGNWRQASKVNTRYKELANIKRVKVARVGTDPYHLRAETTQDGMATLQAIAYALGAIEGEEVQDQLLKLYDEKLVRTLVGRGKLPLSSIK